MAQAAFQFDDSMAKPSAKSSAKPLADTRIDTGFDTSAFQIGWDHARHRLTPPLGHLQAESPVQQGWRCGRAVFGLRTLRASPAVRQWLQLRLSAWVGGWVFEDVQLTPNFLQQIDATQCPITRQPLTHDTGCASDGVVDRVNQRAGFAAGNLATLSLRASQAKAQLDSQQALAIASGMDSGTLGVAPSTADRGDLDAAQWSRLGVLMSFTTPLPHASAALLPLHMLPPNRVRVLNAVQAVQVMLTLQFTQAGYARRLVALAALMPSSETRHCFQMFMHTLLARRLEAGQALSPDAKPQHNAQKIRQAMEDCWSDPLVNRRWQRLALRLTAVQCELFLQRSVRRGLSGTASGSQMQWMSTEQATEGWSLASAGRIQLSPVSNKPVVLPTLGAMPGKLRSFGSQKMASCEALTNLGAFQ